MVFNHFNLFKVQFYANTLSLTGINLPLCPFFQKIIIFTPNQIAMNFIINLVVTAVVALVLSKYVLEGVHIDGFMAAIIFALILGIVNAIVKPVLVVLTIPVTVITLGLFLLVINALMILLVDYLYDGIEVADFWWALGFSILLSIISSVVGGLIGSKD